MKESLKPVLNEKSYAVMVERHNPPSKTYKTIPKAFLIGGTICLIGQLLSLGYTALGADEELASTLVSITLIFLSALFTALGFYDKIAKHGGAGTLVPITGFANAVVSPALEFKSEGFILGVGAKIFTIAGPVIVYGISASVVYGVIYWITTLF